MNAPLRQAAGGRFAFMRYLCIDGGAVQGYALSMHKIPVGVLGASGYAGRELCALVAAHPALSLGFATANDRRGECLRVAHQAVTLVAAEDVSFDSTPLV